ncbi:MAG: sugar phosphate isomerase/epimerase, partial [Armatimonadetes bacterium]|nr:sugar phosphate isomerase/epimerase [Armatimonadota bacterium]
ACADVGYWMRAGLDPIASIQKLRDHLITIQMHDLSALAPDGHDVPWGTGVGQTEKLILEMQRLHLQPVMFGLEYSYNWTTSMPEIAQTVAFFNDLSLQTVERTER